MNTNPFEIPVGDEQLAGSKKTYTVGRREVWVQLIDVEADSPEEALAIALNDGGESGELEFSHFMQSENHTVEENEANNE